MVNNFYKDLFATTSMYDWLQTQYTYPSIDLEVAICLIDIVEDNEIKLVLFRGKL